MLLQKGKFSFLGGDPAAGSPTATLLRLFPPHETQIRRSQGRPRLTQESLGWNDGRCVQGAGTYSPRASDTRLLGIPCSRGWVSTLDPNYGRLSGLPSPFEVGTHCTCHCSSRVAREIRGILTCRCPHLPQPCRLRSPKSAQHPFRICWQHGARVSFVTSLKRTPHGTNWRRPCTSSQLVRQDL